MSRGLAGDFEGPKWAANLELRVGGETLRGGNWDSNGGGDAASDDGDESLENKVYIMRCQCKLCAVIADALVLGTVV